MRNLPVELIDQILKYLSFEEQSICYAASRKFHALTSKYIVNNFLQSTLLDIKDKTINFAKFNKIEFLEGLAEGRYKVILSQEGIIYYDYKFEFDTFVQTDNQKFVSLVADNISLLCDKTCTHPHLNCKWCNNVICKETELYWYNAGPLKVYSTPPTPIWDDNVYISGRFLPYCSPIGSPTGSQLHHVNWDRYSAWHSCTLCDTSLLPICLTCEFALPDSIQRKVGNQMVTSFLTILPHCSRCRLGYCKDHVFTCSTCHQIMCDRCDRFDGSPNWKCRVCKVEKYGCSQCFKKGDIMMCKPCLADQIVPIS